jgi:hypothetical protein
LASKVSLSSGVDCVDVKFVLAAFEEMNKCRLSIEMWVEGTASRPVLMLEMRAWGRDVDRMAVQPLASRKQPIGSLGSQQMEAAILLGLYGLDAQLAEEEFAKTIKK